MTLYHYSVRYRRTATAMGPEHRVQVVARDADDARRMAALADPAFGHTVTSPRRMGEVCPPEQADPLTQAKARDDLLDGVAHFDEPAIWQGCEVEVVG